VSGHNKWSSIKHRKAAQDAKRGAAFNKIIRDLVVAAREGGSDLACNFALASAIEKAKGANMPKDTMEKAVQRGAGGAGGENYERIAYEGRGPAGTAMIVATLTDNKNRTVADLRHIFSKHGGQLADNGSVSWMFERKGMITLKAAGITEDDLLEACADAGADDFKFDDEIAEVYCDPDSFADARAWFRDNKKYTVESNDLALIPKEQVEITEAADARKVLRLIDALDENDDVQTVYSNWSMSDELLEQALE
jgi:YebC/PmpR family DNA-binding regulatory protein